MSFLADPQEMVGERTSEADYQALCAKVDELKNRKQYMDKLLNYYNVGGKFGKCPLRTLV